MSLVTYESASVLISVTSYIELTDFLIDKEKDVQVLRASCTLWNHLSTDVKLAKMFITIGSKCSKPPIDVYSNMKTMIEAHIQRKCAIFMSQGYLNYFSSSWSHYKEKYCDDTYCDEIMSS